MQETLESPFIEGPSSRELEDIINYYLEFYAVEDAVLLAELYYDRAQSEDSLYLLAQCLMRGGQIEATHRLLFVHSNKSPRLRFMYARCCYDLNKLQDAEIALRMDDEPRLHESFEGSPAEPFARSLLARIFLETGRNDSAETEIMKSVESNALSWMGVKSQAEMCQRSDVESGYKKLIVSAKDIRKRMERKDSSIDNVSNNESDDVRTPDVNETSHKVPFAPKKSRSTVLGRKTHEIGVARRRLMEGGGVETRRSARLFGSFQDNENHSVIHLHRDSRHPTHARQLSVTSGISQRTGSDKQLRSMNRINEMEVERCMLNSAPISSPASPSIHKYIEKPNPILESRSKLKSIQPRRTRTTSQSVPTPLASHDQNTPLKEELITLGDAQGSLSSSATSVSSLGSGRPPKYVHSNTHQNTSSVYEPCLMIPPSFKVLTAPLSGGKVCWSHVFVDVVECFSALALAQIALCQYDSSAVLDRLETVPPGFISSACPRELSARAYLEKLDYSKAAEILEKLHRDYPYRMSGMEILSTALWHAQDARRLSVLAAELTEKARQSAVTWCVAGNCFSVQKQHETAIECLKRAVSLDNRFPYAYSLLGHELLDSDQLDGAGQAFRRALLLCPSDYRAWFGLGLMFFKREQFKLAQLHLSRAATINPRNSVLLCQLSVVEQSVHNNDVAIALLERALELSPENAACRFYRARLLYELHRYEECREELNELKLFAHDEAQVFFLLGKVHKKLGDTHLALLNFTWASEMDPHGEQGRSSLSERPYDDEPNSPTSS